jgi:hypothetical protein
MGAKREHIPKTFRKELLCSDSHKKTERVFELNWRFGFVFLDARFVLFFMWLEAILSCFVIKARHEIEGKLF